MYTDEEFIRELKNGSEQAVGELLACYGDRLLRTALAICGDLQLAEEAVQDTMLKACRKIQQFKGDSALSTWLYRIAVNTAKNKKRGGWFRRTSLWDQNRLNLVAASVDIQPEEHVLQKETRKHVLESLQHMPVKYREVLVLFYLEDCSIHQIGQILQQPEGTIKSRLSRGRAMLKERLVREGVNG